MVRYPGLLIQFRMICSKFLGPLDPSVRGTKPDPSTIKQKYEVRFLLFYCFVTSFWLFFFWKKRMVLMYLQKVISEELFLNSFFCVLKVTDEKSRSRICLSEERICESGSEPKSKCHGSGTLTVSIPVREAGSEPKSKCHGSGTLTVSIPVLRSKK